MTKPARAGEYARTAGCVVQPVGIKSIGISFSTGEELSFLNTSIENRHF
jgi:hypothetical protein